MTNAEALTFSKYNIVGPLMDSNDFFIVNPLYQQADILRADEAGYVLDGRDIPDKLQDIFAEKHYLVHPDKEQQAFKEGYLAFLDRRDSTEIQVFFVPTYTCNMSCSYCYQAGYAPSTDSLSTDIIDAFFAYLDEQFTEKSLYLTLFGGEPLLPGAHHKELIRYFIEQANIRNLSIAVVTNGYTIQEYLPVLKQAKLREIQITLDGLEEIHNKRRPLKGGQPTFKRIVSGIDSLLSNNIPVNLRVVIDRENLNQLPELADFAISKGWKQQPHFKTQLGRNYELHECQDNNHVLYDRLSLYQDLYHLIIKHPRILEFHKPAFSIAKFIFEQGNLPDPLYDSCPGCKTEWAFDYTGNIYSCTATVGKEGESLGTFYPDVTHKEEIINAWGNRDILSIPKCTDCNINLACGGGCASVAKNKTGTLLSPDCRPVNKLLGFGLKLYQNLITEEKS